MLCYLYSNYFFVLTFSAIDFFSHLCYNFIQVHLPVWWNWQTRGTQNPVLATECGFDPRHRHQLNRNCIHVNTDFKVLIMRAFFSELVFIGKLYGFSSMILSISRRKCENILTYGEIFNAEFGKICRKNVRIIL